MTQVLTEVIPKIVESAKTNDIKDFKFEAVSQYLWRDSKWEEMPLSVSLTGSFDGAKEAESVKFTAEAQEIFGKTGIQPNVELEKLFKGTAFPQIKGVVPVMDPAATAKDIVYQLGEVTLFDFWATWCGPCQGPMGHNQEMLEKHPDWAGKVRIIGISMDKDAEAPRKRVTEKGWTKVDHYWAKESWNAEVCQYFQIHGIPFCVLVDKQGIIRLSGHPMSMNLEENIPLLIAGSQVKESKEGGEEGGEGLKDKAFNYAACKPLLEEFVKSHAEEYKKLSAPLLVTVNTSKIINGVLEEASNFIVSRFKTGPKAKEAAKKIKDDMNNIFGAKTTIRMQEEETAELKFGEKCSECKAVLGECDQYRCAICPEVYFCVACAEKCPEPKQASDLVHPHGLFFILKGSKEVMGNGIPNCQHNEHPEFVREHGCRCDYCRVQPKGTRWKCLICEDFDMCEECFKIGKNPADPKHKELAEKKPGHIFATHPVVRIEFDRFVICRF